MGLAVVTVASGGLSVVETAFGTPVTEATNLRGIPVTKVIGKPGLPVRFETIGVAPVLVPATLDGTPTAGIVMSNGNLTAVHGTANGNCGVRSNSTKTSGKFYFEVTLQVWVGQPTARVGIILSTGAYTDTNGVNNVIASLATASTKIYANSIDSGYSVGATAVGNIFGVAIDLTNRLAWFRRQNGLWNGNGAADPSTGVNGAVILAGAWSPYIHFGGVTGANATDQMTANFGASAFSGTVPSGFTAGWPV